MEMWPSGPHLSVFVFTRGELLLSLARVVGLLRDDGCSFSGRALISVTDRFEYASDVAREDVAVGSDPEGWLEGLAGSGKVPVSLAFRRPRAGAVSLRLSKSGEVDEPNPLEICCNAGGIGIPVEYRNRDQQRNAKWLVSWTERLLPRLVACVGGEYGAIGIEAELPTPSEFTKIDASNACLPYTWLIPPTGQATPWDHEHASLLRAWDPISDENSPGTMATALDALRNLSKNQGLGPSPYGLTR